MSQTDELYRRAARDLQEPVRPSFTPVFRPGETVIEAPAVEGKPIPANALIICLPARIAGDLPGSIAGKCCRCQQAVVAPAAAGPLVAAGYSLLCRPCKCEMAPNDRLLEARPV